MSEAASWLLPAIGSLCFLFAIGSFILRMPSRAAAVATTALILIVATWNVVSVSAWSLGSAILIIVWMMYTMKRDELRGRGISSGRPLPKVAKWIFVFIFVEAAV